MKKIVKEENKMIYCDNRKCADSTCMRWIKHSSMDKVITVMRFELDKNGKCKNRL